MIKADAVQWLGNRGHDIEESEVIKCKRVGKYLFLLQKEYEYEVEYYDLTDQTGECIDAEPIETFKWNLDYMRKVITKEHYYRW